MKAKSSSQLERSLPGACQLRSRHISKLVHVSACGKFFDHIVENLP